MWAEPAQITGPGINPKNNGPISAQNGWANLDPKYFLFFWAKPDPANLAGPELARPNCK